MIISSLKSDLQEVKCYLHLFPHCVTYSTSQKFGHNHVVTKSKYIISSHPFALMTALQTLGILSTSFMRNAFPNVLDFPHMLSTCWLLFLHSAIQLIPRVIVEARSSDTALHHTPLSNRLRQPRGVVWVISC
jgi:hypothetical protein